MKKIIITLFLITLTISLFSQTEDAPSISADRPGMSTGTDVMPFLKVQWETGFETTLTGYHAITLPTTMIRFGVTRFAEIRLEYDGTLTEDYKKKWEYEVCPLVLGTKVKIFDGYKWVPKISLMANLSIPLTRAQLQKTHVAPSLHLLFQNDITDWFNIGYDVGAEWDGVTAIPATFLGVCLGFSITDNLGAFVESYNYFTKYSMKNTKVECNLDFGFSYTVHPRVQLDLYSAFNCQDPKSFNCIGLGVAWLIN